MTRIKQLIIIFIASFIFNIPQLIAQNKTENIILITLDGMRWQEIFKGIDNRFFDQDNFNSYHYTHEEFKKNF